MTRKLHIITLVIVLWFAGLLAGAQFAKISVFLPELKALYPDHSGQTAWLLTLVSVVGAVLGGVSAGLANRLGLRPVLLLSLVLGGLLSLWQASVPGYGVMAISRVLEGGTHLGIVVTAPALMAEVSSPRWRGASMALWGTFFGVSFALMAWFGIPASVSTGVDGIFLLHGAAMLMTALVLFVLTRNFRAMERESTLSGPLPPSALSILQNIRVFWPALGWLFYTTLFLSLLTILPTGLPEIQRAQVTTVMSLVGIGTGLLLLPILLLRLRATSVVIGAFGLASVMNFAAPMLNLTLFAVGLFAILGLVQSGTFAAVAQLNTSTHMRTLGFGLMAQTGNLGNLLGTPVLLEVQDQFGPTPMLITSASLYAVGFLILWFLIRRV
ncbi:MAG: MFS transporter [Pseudomonadota bacterium]